jgi:hypothetical protein
MTGVGTAVPGGWVVTSIVAYNLGVGVAVCVGGKAVAVAEGVCVIVVGTGFMIGVAGMAAKDIVGNCVGVRVETAVSIMGVIAETAVGSGVAWHPTNTPITKKQSHNWPLYVRICACQNFIAVQFHGYSSLTFVADVFLAPDTFFPEKIENIKPQDRSTPKQNGKLKKLLKEKIDASFDHV